MWFSKKRGVAEVPGNEVAPGRSEVAGASKRTRGIQAEALACDYLTARGMRLVQANFRTPGRGGGEIDLIMRDADGTLVFVEVRQRTRSTQGGAAASIGSTKQRRIIFAARHYISRLPSVPPCRFDVVAIDGNPPILTWLKAAFDAS